MVILDHDLMMGMAIIVGVSGCLDEMNQHLRVGYRSGVT